MCSPNLRGFIFCVVFCIALLFSKSSCADEITLLAAGDVTLTSRISERANLEFLSDGALDLIRQADAFFWNCETSGASSTSKGNEYIFLSEGTHINQFTLPNSIASTSNNHVFDGHEEGALNLMRVFHLRGANHNGLHFKDAYYPFETTLSNGMNLYFLAGGPMSQIGSGPEIITLTYDQILRRVAQIRQDDPDGIIVTYFHDGAEKETEPTSRQMNIAAKCARAGVDVVLFSHAHVYGDFQELSFTPRKTFVAWGLGNFVFGGNSQWRNRDDVRILEIKIDTDTMTKSGAWILGYTSDWKFFLNDE